MSHDIVAKNLLVGKNCNNCRHLNPYEWPAIWCSPNRIKPEAGVCSKHLEGPERGFLPF
jgi:hypothetical protein